MIVAAVLVAILPASDRARGVPPTRAREYSQRQACLLTSDRGLADAAAVPVWAGMQDASAKTRARVMYLAVSGEQSPANAAPFLASLAQRYCTVVLTVGTAPDGAVTVDGPKFPGTPFVVVGGAAGGANVTVLPADSPNATRSAVASAVGSSPPTRRC
ncbi:MULTISPECIES: BMP family ABC transporter substrate-binding protein [unclassified Streptomyces]|uniref:BMP family ABC transporter substrate-binding protein n=1 Tax=unclassified Streptomyces TaxID=2593676 RepID=UPI0024B9A5CE|nr:MULTISPECIES: BMP family ABC transporter substrate-binding protein [unclassified Streptomyces]MDJ0344658.1 BMP family ABC transporter substrate-binding protein [Streptomyces sp. PH10-H1]